MEQIGLVLLHSQNSKATTSSVMHMIAKLNIFWKSLLVLFSIEYRKCESVMRPVEEVTARGDGAGVLPEEGGYMGEVGHCLREGGAVGSCMTAGAFVMLQTAVRKESLPIYEDMELHDNDIDSQETRTVVPVDADPTDFYSLMEASTKFLQRRTLRWNLESLFPGLEMCIGSVNAGPPSLHFLLDPRKGHDERRLSTGRLLVKRAVLPYILGLKINLIAIIPLVFAALIFLTKKAFMLSKFAFLFTTIAGLASASQYAHQQQHHVASPPSLLGPHSFYDGSLYRDSHRKRGDETSGRNFRWEDKAKKSK
ncbi:hypothetical protein LSTR_LSTR010353 [Laodelphax striatellus]|uniref:Osiris 18 n=1 Tax=Laodelphax striatellus TaxID=195883 RepID=A0A482X0D8_LAOST|nr:hypothetical protein LSTR_LSTR010353 [Laodelphax striatellus]